MRTAFRPRIRRDSAAHKSEGAFYLWRADELDALLGPDAELVKGRFGVEPNGNAPSDPQQEFVGKNLLYVAQSVEDLAQRFNRDVEDVGGALTRARIRMFEVQLGRPRPHLDDKVLTAWNGLMIAAFARAARVVLRFDISAGPSPYLAAAQRAAGFIPRSALAIGFERRCSGDSGTATPKSRATRKITRTSSSDFSSCFKRTAILHGSSGRSSSSAGRMRYSATKSRVAGSAPPAGTGASC